MNNTHGWKVVKRSGNKSDVTPSPWKLAIVKDFGLKISIEENSDDHHDLFFSAPQVFLGNKVDENIPLGFKTFRRGMNPETLGLKKQSRYCEAIVPLLLQGE